MVAAVIAVIFVLKVIAAVSALVLAFVPAIIALGGGYAAGQIQGARRERRKLEAKRSGPFPSKRAADQAAPLASGDQGSANIVRAS